MPLPQASMRRQPPPLPRLPAPRPPPPPTAPLPAPVDPYATAESAMRRGDVEAARSRLIAIIEAAPASVEAAVAPLDLARLAASGGDTSGALGYLARLDRHPHHAMLAVPAARLLASLASSDAIPRSALAVSTRPGRTPAPGPAQRCPGSRSRS
jgi:hypothetical protein